MRTGLIAAASALLATSVAAQASTTVSQSMPPTATAGFNIAPIPQQRRFQWCLAQQNNCPLICGGTTDTNTCEQIDLTYSCICSNGTVPDVSAYQDTIPFYICEETYRQCIEANPNDAQGQDGCVNNQQCGTLNATTVESSSDSSPASSSSSASMTSATSTASESAASGASATPTNGAVAVSQQLATGAFAAVFFAAFKLLL